MHDHARDWCHRLKHVRGLTCQQVAKVAPVGHSCTIYGCLVQREVRLQVIVQGQRKGHVIHVFIELKVIPHIEKGIPIGIVGSLRVAHRKTEFLSQCIEPRILHDAIRTARVPVKDEHQWTIRRCGLGMVINVLPFQHLRIDRILERFQGNATAIIGVGPLNEIQSVRLCASRQARVARFFPNLEGEVARIAVVQRERFWKPFEGQRAGDFSPIPPIAPRVSHRKKVTPVLQAQHLI